MTGGSLVIGGLVILAFACRLLYVARQSTRWPRVIGTIDETQVHGSSDDHAMADGVPSRTSYWQDVLYRYEVNGRHLAADRTASARL